MDEYMRSFRGRIDRRHIAPVTIAVVGVGRVGGWLALELARLVPHRLVLIDGDNYEERNVSGHPLPAEYVGMNKAVAMADWLEQEVPGIEITAIPYYVDEGIEDDTIYEDVIEPAAVVVVATDKLEVQRRVADLARSAEVPAIIPGIAADGSGRGEAFISFSEDQPCFSCFDGFRPADAPVRGAAAVALDAAPAVHLGFSLTLAVLDPNSREAELLTPLREGGPVPQLFRAWPPGSPELAHADSGATEVPWRQNCPGCGGRREPVMTRRRAMRQRQEQRRRDRPSWEVPRRLAWSLYLLELFVLVVFSALSGGEVVGIMAASLTLGFGYWAGRRFERVVARPG
ncbi:MAG: molybdopterin-synthase adenylyltransferase [Solirubrobacterales bacterium]|jgi:molybdopterin/thiamine biosynthesis adenylyltransferase|nr:molybdopterin-synthase adenylyltransferase [Solirubrobacterales bacterium]